MQMGQAGAVLREHGTVLFPSKHYETGQAAGGVEFEEQKEEG